MVRIAAIVVAFPVLALAGEPAKVSPRTALQPFQSLIGTWKGTGVPEGTREERQSGFWTEGWTESEFPWRHGFDCSARRCTYQSVDLGGRRRLRSPGFSAVGQQALPGE